LPGTWKWSWEILKVKTDMSATSAQHLLLSTIGALGATPNMWTKRK
jgi:hypothetical protein